VRVDFYAGATLVGQATMSPWAATWVAVAGDYDLTAIATDDKGLSKTSAPVSITVAGPVPSDRHADPRRGALPHPGDLRAARRGGDHGLRNQGYEGWLVQQFAARPTPTWPT
jgi:hypothetical protein